MQQAIVPGTVIDKRYQIQNQLPDTTSNRCYLAEDTDQSNRLVIISFPKLELQTIPGFTSAFEDACQRLIKARLNGIIKILNHGEYESQPYSIIQYVTHETLAILFTSLKNKGHKVSIDEVLDWARPLAVTLDELHGMNYVHSNVRPATIYLGQKRQILLGDFVTEFTIQRLGAFKQAVSSLDIADYLAPEYIKSLYDKSYDQYLLATIIFEALAGRSHFHNPGSSEAYRRQVATKFPETLLTQRPELIGVSRILSKALERNPTKRFDNCRDFINQLGLAQVTRASDDKPVTVIKKVLDLDETAPVEPIITSIRSNRGAGKKKGLIWLGVLLLGIGAGTYAVNQFGGLEQLKTKLSTVFNNQPDSSEPVIIPVDVSNKTPQVTESTNQSSDASAPSEPLINISANTDSSKTSSDDSAVVITNISSAQSNTDGLGTQVAGTPSDAKADTITSADSFVAPKSLIASEVEQGEGELDTKTANTKTSLPEPDADDADLISIVYQALTQGQAEFKNQQEVNSISSEVAEINDAISAVLQEAEVDFMRKASPAVSIKDSGANPSAVNPLNSNQEVLSGSEPEDNSQALAEKIPDAAEEEGQGEDAAPIETTEPVEGKGQDGHGTEKNTPLSASEAASQDLQGQMFAANKLADERAAKKQEREGRKNASDDTNNNKEKEPTEKSESTAKSLKEMQQERARIQAIKTQEIARINDITKDCTTSRKIHRQAVAGNLPYVKNCLSVGVSPNLTQSNRWTLLHLASLGGYLNMAKLLVAKGADVNAKSVDGKTPLDMANEKKQTRMIDYLRKRGGVTTR